MNGDIVSNKKIRRAVVQRMSDEDKPKLKKNRPLLRGKLSYTKHYPSCRIITVWCPYCAEDHRHGWPFDEITKPEHRWAHCDSDSNSPFEEKGYYIQPEPGELKRVPQI